MNPTDAFNDYDARQTAHEAALDALMAEDETLDYHEAEARYRALEAAKTYDERDDYDETRDFE